MTVRVSGAGLRGITLAQYAGVHAGLAAGFPLERVLSNEAVDPAIWPFAEEAWEDRLDEDVEGEWLLDERYDGLLAEASERYARRLPPLDNELAAWLDFIRIWSDAEQPTAMLAELGLRSGDLARLHRLWSRKLAEEPALQRAAQTLLARAPERLPVPKPEEREPVPPRPDAEDAVRLPGPAFVPPVDDEDDEDDEDESAAPPRPPVFAELDSVAAADAPPPAPSAPIEAVHAPEPASEESGPIGFIEYASIVAELEVVPHERSWILTKFGLAEPDLPRIEAYFGAKFTKSPDDAADFERVRARMVKHWRNVHGK